MYTKTVFGGFAGLAIVILVGCMGDDPDSLPDISNVTLGGTAAKGIINLGNVVAEELDDNGTAITRVGSTVTGVDGSYRLTVDRNYRGGPIRVTVSADENTQMKCDAPSGCGARTDDLADSNNTVDFSEWYKPRNLTMTALIAKATTNDSIDVNITPYTHLAANRAMASGSLSTAGIYRANSEVSNLLGGIDILKTDLLDITDSRLVTGGSAMEIAHAAFLAAIASLADISGGNLDIDNALAVLSSSFSGGTIMADDSGIDDNIISLQEIIDGANNVLEKINIADTSGTIAYLQADVDNATAAGGNVDPQPSPVTGAAALAKVKAFVSDMRTWATVIEAETRAERGAFIQQVNLASTAASMSHKLLTGPALDGVFAAIMQNFSGMATDGALADYTVGAPDDPQFSAGIIVNAAGIVTIIDAVINDVTVNMNIQLPADGLTASTFTLGIISASVRSAATDADINSGNITFNTSDPYTINWMVDDPGAVSIPSISSGSINLDMVLTQKQDSLGEPLAAEVTFMGNLSVTLGESVSDGSGDNTTLNTLVMGGNVSDTAGNSLDANIVANTTGAAGILPLGPLSTGAIGLNFTLQLAGLPEASVNISSSRTGFYTSGITTVIITYGLRQIIMDSSYAGFTATGKVIITNQDGVSIVMDNDFKISPGGIAYNGQLYADIVHLNNGLTKIIYTDGTFEIL